MRLAITCFVAAAFMVITAFVMTDSAELIIEHIQSGWRQTAFVSAGLFAAAFVGVALSARLTERSR